MVAEEVKEEKPVKEKKARKAKAKKESKEEAAATEAKEEKSEEQLKAELEEKKKRIIEKAKKLAEGMRPVVERKDLEREIGEKKEKLSKADDDLKGLKADNMIVPLDDYVKAGIYLGTKVITPDMRQYVFKRRADGLAIINTKLADEKIRAASSFLSEYAPEKIVVAGKREAGWKALNAFSKATGIRVFTKKYPAGIITNINLPEFFEPDLALIIDPWIDKNLLADSTIVNIPVISLCDTNNLTLNIDLIIPCNNKSGKSIGLVFWILAREYMKARDIKADLPPLSDFMTE